jgi:hypothetical protein
MITGPPSKIYEVRDILQSAPPQLRSSHAHHLTDQDRRFLEIKIIGNHVAGPFLSPE